MATLRLRFWMALGRFANRVGFPGIVRDCLRYYGAFGTLVQVRRSGFYTVVSVNGVDVYFNRFSGRLDGIGGAPAALGAPEAPMEVQ